MSDEPLTPDSPPPTDPLALALSKLDPAPHGFDRDALMFAAGGASKLRLVTLWRTVAVVAMIAAAFFATLYFTKPKQAEYTTWPSNAKR